LTNTQPIPILLCHSEFIVVNKPSGIEMHDSESGIISMLKRQLNTSTLFLVHRLDKGTSGCLLIATHKAAAAHLALQFEHRTVKKQYLALIDKKPKKKQGRVMGDMVNKRRGQWALLQTKHNPAITYFNTYSVFPGTRLVLVKPITGKTHQIRVALKSLGAPIIGDIRYGGTQSDRLYLHAWQLRFNFNHTAFHCIAPISTGEKFTGDEVTQCLLDRNDAQIEP
jgi:tRNA pseudouridine32 synthase/23S rRNA pseudouridine746 synthase